MRPGPPFYVGRTRPSSIGWTRIGITAGSGIVLAVLMHERAGMAGTVLLSALFAALTLWTWMGRRRKIYTLDDLRAPYRVLATGPGTMVEIIGRGSRHYLISPVDPQATAEAVDQAIRARR